MLFHERLSFIRSSFFRKIWIMPMNVFKHFVNDILFSLSVKSRIAGIEELRNTISPFQFQKHISGIGTYTLCCIL